MMAYQCGDTRNRNQFPSLMQCLEACDPSSKWRGRRGSKNEESMTGSEIMCRDVTGYCPLQILGPQTFMEMNAW